MIHRLGLLLISSMVLISCGTDKTRESYGLQVIEIQLPEDRKTNFIADFRGDVTYEAEIKIDGEENQGTISPAGSTSISLFKKSLDCEITAGSRNHRNTSFRLSAQKTDTTLLKSLLGFEYYRRLGLLVPRVEPVVVYVNGELWGLYIKIERIDESFFNRNNLNVDLLYKADNGARFDEVTAQRPNFVFDVKIGEKNFEILKQLSYLLKEPDRHQNQINKIIDPESFRRLSRGIALLNHWDSLGNNFHMYRLKGRKDLLALPWDLDAILDLKDHPYLEGTLLNRSNNPLFNFAINQDLNTHLTNLRSDLTTHFTGAQMDAITAPYISSMRAAYQADPVLGGAGLSLDSEYARLRADALSWWNSVDQELTTLGF